MYAIESFCEVIEQSRPRVLLRVSLLNRNTKRECTSEWTRDGNVTRDKHETSLPPDIFFGVEDMKSAIDNFND